MAEEKISKPLEISQLNETKTREWIMFYKFRKFKSQNDLKEARQKLARLNEHLKDILPLKKAPMTSVQMETIRINNEKLVKFNANAREKDNAQSSQEIEDDGQDDD